MVNRISLKEPTYMRIIRDYHSGFPMVSNASFKALWKVMSYAKSQMKDLDFQRPIINKIGLDAAPQRLLAEKGLAHQKVISHIISLFNGLPNWAHPLVMKNLMPPTTAVSVVTAFLTSLFNPDVCSPEFSGDRIAETEEKVVEVLCELVGYDPRIAYGFFTYGGTLGIQLGILLSLEKVSPGRYLTGQEKGVKILCSDVAHFSVRDAVGRLGVGAKNVILVKSEDSGEMDLIDLEKKGDEILRQKQKIAAVVATAGTTDAFGIDDLPGIRATIERWNAKHKLEYPISLLADSVAGWAWTFFNDYDFEANPLQFPNRTLEVILKITQKLKGLDLADVICVNPHKYGFVSIPASFILFKEGTRELSLLRRRPENMPQLYGVSSQHPGAYTIETTRYAGGILATAANLLLFGKIGYQATLGRIVEMGLLFRKRLAELKNVEIINQEGLGGGTIFYFKLTGENITTENFYNRKLLDYLENEKNEIMISSTFQPGGRIAIKSLIISPFTSPKDINKVIQTLSKAASRILPDSY